MKEIAELIHDRAFAEGATVVVWTNDAKLRVIPTVEGREYLRPRTMHVRSKLTATDLDGDVKVPGYIKDCVSSFRFKPSDDLIKIMKRNACEFQAYLDHMVREWRAEVEAIGGVRENSSGPSCQTTEPSRTRGSRTDCDCHAGLRSEISEKTAKSGARAVLAAIAVAGWVFGSSVAARAPIGADGVRPDADGGGASAFSGDFYEICAARAPFGVFEAPFKG